MARPLIGLLSLAGGALLMMITKLFAVECRMAEPGGINEGGAGFPIPYSSCGVWGESFSWTFALLDFVLLSLAVYVVIMIGMKIATKR